MELCYILGNGNLEKISYISASNFPSSKNKKRLFFLLFFISGNGSLKAHILFLKKKSRRNLQSPKSKKNKTHIGMTTDETTAANFLN